MADLYSLYRMVTLKIRSRSSKSIQLFSHSQHCINATLVKIHPLVQKITHRNLILDISKCRCDLENNVKVTKISSTLSILPTMYLCKFGQMPSTSSEDNAQNQSHAEADGIHTSSLWLGDIIMMQKTDKIDKLKK